MNDSMIEICGEFFDSDIEHFSFAFEYGKAFDMAELEKLKAFPHLSSASFTATLLTDQGLEIMAQHAKGIDNLNLQETKVSNAGLRHLAQLPALQVLRLKENWQLDNGCVDHLNVLQHLTNLQIHETSIDQEGYRRLQLPQLEDLLINQGDKEVILALSRRMPQCRILVKGKLQCCNGNILWER